MTVEDQLFVIMEKHGISWEDALALSDSRREWLVEQEPGVEIPEDDPEEDPEGEGEEEGEPAPDEPQEPVDDYAGPQEQDVVGDDRRLRIVAVDPHSGQDVGVVGEAWQGDGMGSSEKGRLYGTGIAAVMLYEPSAHYRHRNASLTVDQSPLTILYARVARSPFFRAELVEVGDG